MEPSVTVEDVTALRVFYQDLLERYETLQHIGLEDYEIIRPSDWYSNQDGSRKSVADVPLGQSHWCCSIAVRLGVADAYELLPFSLPKDDSLADEELRESLERHIDIVRRTLALALGHLNSSTFLADVYKSQVEPTAEQEHKQTNAVHRNDVVNEDIVNEDIASESTSCLHKLGVTVDQDNRLITAADPSSGLAAKLGNATRQWNLFSLLFESFPSGLTSRDLDARIYGEDSDGSTDRLNNVHQELNKKLRVVKIAVVKSSDQSAVWRLAKT